ncbi:MAG: hypothetical protein CFE38_17650 [Comamonadaceae bacterium PBBC1]|nr:MAG: hypothetical protein CFE38_17650 [Comamonadaceae bacterium PBBC1]
MTGFHEGANPVGDADAGGLQAFRLQGKLQHITRAHALLPVGASPAGDASACGLQADRLQGKLLQRASRFFV